MLTSLRDRQELRAGAVTQNLLAQKQDLGLGALDGFLPYNQITDEYGQTHVRYHQTFRGVEVYNGTILGHLDAAGKMLAPHSTLQPGIDLQPVKLVDEDVIRSVVAQKWQGGGQPLPMQVKVIVFPTKYQDGIKFKRDAEGRFVLDPLLSVGTRPKTDAYRWAYQVTATQACASGFQSYVFIIDGLTQEILKSWDGVQYADTPSVGSGNSQYNGTVALNTSLLGDGSNLYTLRDTVRATKPWPFQSQWNPIALWDGIGAQTLCYDANAWSSGWTMPFTSLTNTWGDGQAFTWSLDYPGNINTTHGQTAAVDAHYATQCTWDYYLNVLNRTGGIDGKGSSPLTFIHLMNGSGNAWYNASWSPSQFLMMYGDGAPTGSLATLDIAAHEMSHGVMSYTAGLQEVSGAESGHLNEANSDIHATMVKYYYWGANGQGSVVPDTTTLAPGGNNTWEYLWTMGSQLSTDGLTPMRWLYKPSKDGVSYDAWFDGIGLDDFHYGMGPGNRAFFFLSQGASSDKTKENYSEYLPSGMKGLGNDKSIKIWYNAMATKVTDTLADYHSIRQAMIDSAAELFHGTGSADSTEVAAVKNAFAAINVGAAEGAAEPVKIVFQDRPGSAFNYGKTIVVPCGIPVALPSPVVSNAADTSFTWSLGGLSTMTTGGKIVDNKYVAPMVNLGASWPLKATSNQNPKAFAVDLVFAVELDCDSDSDTDACDLGAMALAYGLKAFYPGANLYGNADGPDDICVWLLVEGLNNAYNH